MPCNYAKSNTLKSYITQPTKIRSQMSFHVHEPTSLKVIRSLDLGNQFGASLLFAKVKNNFKTSTQGEKQLQL